MCSPPNSIYFLHATQVSGISPLSVIWVVTKSWQALHVNFQSFSTCWRSNDLIPSWKGWIDVGSRWISNSHDIDTGSGEKRAKSSHKNWSKTYDKKNPVWTRFFRRCPQKFFAREFLSPSSSSRLFLARAWMSPPKNTRLRPYGDLKSDSRFQKLERFFYKNRNSRSGSRPVGAKFLLWLLVGTGLSGAVKNCGNYFYDQSSWFSRQWKDDLSEAGVGTVAKRIFFGINGLILAGHAWTVESCLILNFSCRNVSNMWLVYDIAI